jgi:hypothetical protein
MIPRELICDAVDHGSMPLDERLKGGRITARRAGHEVRISHSGLGRATARRCRARATAGRVSHMTYPAGRRLIGSRPLQGSHFATIPV